MKKLINLLFFSLITLISFPQELIKIQNQIDSLKELKNQMENEIKLINVKLKELEDQKTISQFKYNESFDYVVNQKLQIKIREKDNSSSKIIYEPRNGETLRLLDFNIESKYWTVKINDIFGYVNEIFLQDNPQIDEFKKNIILIKSKNIEAQQHSRQLAIKQDLAKRFGTYNAERILNHEYWIGMTDEMAIISLGTPTDINRSVGSWGIHEQWVYEKRNLYLYFENGKLTSYQNKK